MIVIVGLLILLASTAHALSDGIGQNYQGRCMEKEKEALLRFKRVVDTGDILSSWTNNSTNKNCCNWSGITCDEKTNHVVMVDLHYYRSRDYAIGGEIGSSLVELQHLNYLDLSGNNFSRIPKFIGSLKELTYLNLAGNPISGTFPPELGNLTKLQYLDLSSYSYHNQMIVENEWLSHLASLRTLRLMNANFSKDGFQSFIVPPSLSELRISNCLLPKVDTLSLSCTNSSLLLSTLVLYDNYIHPSAIAWLLNSSSNLIDLTITNNIIHGSFPNSFGEKNSLSHVSLDGNEVQSGIPKSMGNLTNLKYLDLSSNNLSGTLHDLLENLTGSTKNSLEILQLSLNQLGGLILDDEKAFPSLRILYLDSNQLEGPFPNRLSRFPILQVLSLYKNQITGPLPDLSSMSRLTSFIASSNRFNGTSTESIGELFNLEIIDISSNSITGDISELLNLQCPRLKGLDLSFNSVTLKVNSSWVPSFQLQFLKLTSCKLGPQFPSWLQTQSSLSHLDISNSEISGVVPNWFSNITSNLNYLNMSFNFLNNTLPNIAMRRDYDEVIVDLSFNQFHGPIPPSLSYGTYYYLSNNKFTDCRSLLCSKSYKRVLDLADNQLSGSLPDCRGNFEYLVVLDLRNNKLSGEIPSSIISSLRDIQTLQLRLNNFSGNLPFSLKNCIDLRVLDLGKNLFSGAIPSWIGENLTSLVFLSLKSNKFYGSIPFNLCRLTEIQVLDLSLNDLSGAIPSCINNLTSMAQMATNSEGVLSRSHRDGIYSFLYDNVGSIIWKGVEHEYDKNLGFLRVIDLSSNKLTGEIPVEVTHLVELVQLNLSRNDLSGAIPNKIGNLTKLESLDLSRNELFGKIPISLAEISSLAYLDLSVNRLSGRIPTGTQLQSFNDSTYIMNLGLCGPPLTSLCPGDETLHNPSTSTSDVESSDEDSGEWFDMSWFYVGIGVGFIIGFLGVCGNLAINTAWRNAYFQFMHGLGDWLYVMITVKGAALRRKLDWD